MVMVKNVSKKYGNKYVLDDVSVTIPERQVTSLIGPNGAGKSTLLAMMSRLGKKDSGQVFIENKEVGDWKLDDLAQKMSILKQANNINLRITVRELVAFGRFPYSKGRLNAEDERLIDEALMYMDLTRMQDKFLDQLSGGQKQCAHIAMVIAQDTDYIFLDEPLNNLDMKHSVQIMKTLRQLVNDLGKTIVIVIHDINFASCYSDYIVALRDGRLVHEGKTCDIITPAVLKDIYDMDMPVQEISNNKICVYFS
ncbi:MAG: ABC transporter ATP-binding protein [Neisseriaceae bacterium]|nr:ABC transporter ATP-binding protein [Neisseriaceae bacterium]